MGLPVELNNKIVEFLKSLPNIHDSNSQRALLLGAGLDSELQGQIYFSGPPAQFFQLLIPTLLSYGTLKDGRDALEAVLEAAKNSVGQDKQRECDTLIQELRSFRSPSSQPTVSSERPSIAVTDREVKTGSVSHFDDTAQEQKEEKTVSFSWLHLTDFHCGMKNQHWLWPGVREIFFDDLKRLHEKCGPWDLVLFTGDLSQKGNAKEFEKVDKILEQLWKYFDRLGFPPQLLAVPGNHDLVRPNSKDPSVRLLQQWEDQADIREEFWEEAESPYRQVVTNAFENYTTWWKKQPFRVKNTSPGILPGDFSVTIEKNGAKLGILGLNTSFLQLTDDNYEGKLALHTRQFHEACDDDGPAWAKQHHACLLLSHHPPTWLNPSSQQHLKGEITDHERFVVHLCGHMHETVYRSIAEGGTEARRLWQGRSLFGLEYYGKEHEMQRMHGYTVGKIELSGNTGKLMFWPREDRLQGGQRNLVPDLSIHLPNNEHTQPVEFKLLQPCSIRIASSANGIEIVMKQIPQEDILEDSCQETQEMNIPNTFDTQKTIVPDYQYDIAVSYAPVDDQPTYGEEEGWVTTLIKVLKIQLARKLGNADAFSLWSDHQLPGNVPISEMIDIFRNAATLVVILSPGYLISDWCQRQKTNFLSMVKDRVRSGSRVFVVERDQLEVGERPSEFADLRGYQFWVKDREGKPPRSLIPKRDEALYHDRMNELSYDLVQELRRLKTSGVSK